MISVSLGQFYVDGVVHLQTGSSFIYVDADVVNDNGGTISNNGTLHVTGDFSNSGTATVGGTVKFKGSTQSITGTTVFNDVDVENNSTSSITSGNSTVQGIIAIAGGSTLNANNRLTVASGASLLHGSGTPGGSGTVNGTLTVQRTGSSNPNVYNYWTSPITNGNISSLGAINYYYNPDVAADISVELTLREGWVAASGAMTSGLGYISTGAGTASFTGTANNGNIGVQVRKNQGTPANNVGFNLVGNPYPSSLTAATFLSNNSSLIAGAIYLWDDDGSGGAGYSTADYLTWNNMGTVAGPNSGQNFTGHVASCQSFFVNKTANGAANVNFTNAMRGTTNDAFFRQESRPRLWMSITNSGVHYNETLIGFADDATEGEDWAYDAEKIRGNAAISLYTRIDEKIFAIQGLPTLTDNDRIVPLGMDAAIAGEHTLRVRTMENFDETSVIYLEDRDLGVFQNLRVNPEYEFNSPAGQMIDRFYLHFRPPLEIAFNEESCDGSDAGIILDQHGSQVWQYVLSDAEGTVITSGNDLNGELTISGLSAGEYQLELADASGYQTSSSLTLNGMEPVTAGFLTDQAEIFEQEEIAFINQSTGADQLSWDFGDGYFSSEQNPVHIYAIAGTYLARLTASNEDCSVIAERNIIVNSAVTTGLDEDIDDLVHIFGDGSSVIVEIKQAFTDRFDLEIINTGGQLIAVRNGLNANSRIHRISLDDISSGCYFIRLSSDEHQITKPLILGIE